MYIPVYIYTHVNVQNSQAEIILLGNLSLREEPTGNIYKHLLDVKLFFYISQISHIWFVCVSILLTSCEPVRHIYIVSR